MPEVKINRPFSIELGDLIHKANQPGHNHRIITIGNPTPWLIDVARENTLHIERFTHIVDTSAIRHILTRHGDAKEKARGGIPLARTDIELIPHILSEPNQVAFGAISKQGKQLIVYIKQTTDGTLILMEEVRNKTLALKTMRKYPATINVLLNADLYVRNDGRTPLTIVNFAKIST